MMKWISVVLISFLTACSSNAVKKHYQLPVLEGEKPVTFSREGISTKKQQNLWISQVRVADFLGNSGLVYQTSEVQYVMASNNLWASPLDQQLQQSLQTYLSRSLPGRIISNQQFSDDNQEQLSVDVTGFHGRYDGKVIIRGSWTLSNKFQVSQHFFNLVLKQDKDGYDALVAVMATGWREEADRIASSIR